MLDSRHERIFATETALVKPSSQPVTFQSRRAVIVRAMDTASLDRSLPLPLFLIAVFYGGMTCIAGVLGAKQVALGPLAVEAGIFPFLLLVVLSSSVAELYGRPMANRLVRLGFVPLVTAILLTLLVIQLPTDPGMYGPAKAAFPIVLGQSWRLMAAGIAAYGVSMTLNVLVFSKLAHMGARLIALRGAIASVLSQVVDTLIFITVAFYGVRPIGALIAGQALAKVTLSIVLVPPLISIVVRLARAAQKKAGVGIG